ncbi:MAG: hypothetical protein OJF59_000839 [Cytophagales bacterium]|jgi:hypothetical protein|nr:MAG: hypothetical protein OJF59_000839 [Cytophagales bacterium]
MTYDTLSTAATAGHYIAYFAWTVLVILIIRQIFKRDIKQIKVLFLYLINSGTFIIGWFTIVKLALIVRAPIQATEQESIATLRDQADNFLTDFIISVFILTSILTIINVLYLKYFAKTKTLKHALILFIGVLTILSAASYISTEWYYEGLLQEIYRHFH